ncbi:MAG: cytochrome c-type biogenesis protein [Pseudomonadota bacterium]
MSVLLGLGPIVGLKDSMAATLPPEELLDDPALEQRARDLAATLRCVVCANQSIADSEASLALDMQRFIRRELASGASDERIVAALVSRYGDRVLLNPPITPRTYLLWGLPFALTILIGTIIWVRRRPKQDTALAPLAIDDWRQEGPG